MGFMGIWKHEKMKAAISLAILLLILITGVVSGDTFDDTSIVLQNSHEVLLADFSSDIREGPAPLAVTFTDLTRGAVINRTWKFGDGVEDNSEKPIYIYNTTGLFSVTLIVEGQAGSDQKTRIGYINVTESKSTDIETPEFIPETSNDSIVKEDPLKAFFTPSAVRGITPTDIVFREESTGNISEYHWDFGDGEESTTNSPVHTYTKAGTYTVILTVSDGIKSDSSSVEIIIKEPQINPKAAFSISADSGSAPLEVAFSDRSSGTIMSYKWNFGDGTESNLQNPVHIYNSTGKYEVVLTVIGPTGADKFSKPDAITVFGYDNETNAIIEPFSADFSVSSKTGSAPMTVSFLPEIVSDDIQYLWDFGDQNTSYLKNPVHIYEKPGEYSVRLTILDENGNTDTKIKNSFILVSDSTPAPNADFSTSMTEASINTEIAFTDLSDGKISTYHWDFGDGVESDQRQPVHKYETPGTFDVNLFITGPGGSDELTSTDCITIIGDGKATDNDTFENNSEFISNPITPANDIPENNTGSNSNTGSNTGSNISKYEDTKVSDESNITNNITNCQIPDVIVDKTSGTVPLTVNFETDVSDIECMWDLGDGFTSYEAKFSHTYNKSGNYTVTMVYSGNTCNGEIKKQNFIIVNETPIIPIAEFTSDITSGIAPLSVTFESKSSGTVTELLWNTGDNSTDVTGGAITHLYENPGIYTIKLTASGPSGKSVMTKTDYVTVTAKEPESNVSDNTQISPEIQPIIQYVEVITTKEQEKTKQPFADFYLPVTWGTIPFRAEFKNNSSGVVDNWLWNFGDGNKSTEEDPVNIYNKTGNYTISLTAYGPGGSYCCTKADYLILSETKEVAKVSEIPTPSIKPEAIEFFRNQNYGSKENETVKSTPDMVIANNSTENNKLKANFDLSKVKGHAPLSVHAKDLSTGDVTEWEWDFGDGEVSSAPDTNHIYLIPGKYDVSLKITGPDGTSRKRVKNAVDVF